MRKRDTLTGPEEIMHRLGLPWRVIRGLADHEGLPLKEKDGQFSLSLTALKKWEVGRK